MAKLFGIPMGILAVVLVSMLVAALSAVAVVAARNRVFLRLGVRNAERRPGRSALIVVGLMLGTAIIAAALATGDTMSQTIRSSAVSSLGQTDELVSARGATPTVEAQSGAATGVRYFPQADFAAVRRAVAGSPLVDGVAPAIIEPVAVQAPRQPADRAPGGALRKRRIRASRVRRDHAHRRPRGLALGAGSRLGVPESHRRRQAERLAGRHAAPVRGAVGRRACASRRSSTTTAPAPTAPPC